MRTYYLLLIVISLVVSCISVSAETISRNPNKDVYDIIRSVGAICGAGLSTEVKGELDAKIARLFGGIKASGEARLDTGLVADLLKQFSDDESKQAGYRTYVTCVIQTVNAIVGVSEETGEDLVIDNLIVPDPLIIIKNNQKFAMRVGETRAIGRSSLIFTINGIAALGTGRIFFSYSDLETGKSIVNSNANQSNTIKFYEGCTIVPYLIDTTKGDEKVSFYTKCKP